VHRLAVAVEDVLRVGVFRDVLAERACDARGEGDHAAAAALGLGDATSGGLLDAPVNVYASAEPVDVAGVECDQLALPEPAVAGGEDERPASRVDRLGEPLDVDGGGDA
jgi:hypothetical protein